MNLSPLAAIPPVVQGGMELVIGVYREVSPTHIIEKANGKFDEGIAVLEENRKFMTQEQLTEIFIMSQRVEAARPAQASGSIKLLDALRNPFGKVTMARKFKRLCKEYQRLVQRISQTARVEAAVREALLALNDKNKVFDVPQAVALEIERAKGPGAEMSTAFCDAKLSAGAKTSVHLQFTTSCTMTVDLGLIQIPSLVRSEGNAAPVLHASGDLVHTRTAVEGDNIPRQTSPESNVLPAVISLSGTATIFPRQREHRDLHHDHTNVRDKNGGSGITYGLRFDSLEYHAEVAVAPTKDD